MPVIIIIIVMFAASPIIAQIRYDEVHPEYIKRINLGKYSCFFRGVGFSTDRFYNIKEKGIMLPMFIMQLVGYILAIVSLIVFLFLYFFNVNEWTIAISFAVAFAIESITLIIVMIVTTSKSKKRKKIAEETAINNASSE